MKKILPEEITFLIQGPICSNIQLSIHKIRTFAPQSKIILSSIDKTVDGLQGFDDFISSEDPGYFYYSFKRSVKPNNINRQIVTTLNGLKRVRTKYCFKLRSDFLIHGLDWLDYLDKFNKTDPQFLFTKEKLLACTYFSRNPFSSMAYPYHFSDLLFFGLTEDLISIFDIPLMSDKDAYVIGKHKKNRYTPEQYIMINALKKSGRNPTCDFFNDTNLTNQIETEKYFASNFVFLNFEQFQCKPTKDHFDIRIHPVIFKHSYTHIEWMRLYKKHIEPNISIPEVDKDREDIDNSFHHYKQKSRIAQILSFWIPIRHFRMQLRNYVLNKIL